MHAEYREHRERLGAVAGAGTAASLRLRLRSAPASWGSSYEINVYCDGNSILEGHHGNPILSAFFFFGSVSEAGKLSEEPNKNERDIRHVTLRRFYTDKTKKYPPTHDLHLHSRKLCVIEQERCGKSPPRAQLHCSLVHSQFRPYHATDQILNPQVLKLFSP
jgi:hypothetical protein